MFEGGTNRQALSTCRLLGFRSSQNRIAFAADGYGSKNRYQNGTLVSANLDQNLRNPSSEPLNMWKLRFGSREPCGPEWSLSVTALSTIGCGCPLTESTLNSRRNPSQPGKVTVPKSSPHSQAATSYVPMFGSPVQRVPTPAVDLQKLTPGDARMGKELADIRESSKRSAGLRFP